MLLAPLLRVMVEKIDYIDGSIRSSRLTDQPPERGMQVLRFGPESSPELQNSTYNDLSLHLRLTATRAAN